MNTATATRIAAGVTAAYVRELTRHTVPTAGDVRRDERSYRRERGHASALDASGRRRGRPGHDRSPRRARVEVPKRVSERAQVVASQPPTILGECRSSPLFDAAHRIEFATIRGCAAPPWQSA
jgi:hypothetical protein